MKNKPKLKKNKKLLSTIRLHFLQETSLNSRRFKFKDNKYKTKLQIIFKEKIIGREAILLISFKITPLQINYTS